MNDVALSNLGFILVLLAFSFLWLRFSSGLTLRLFRPLYQRLKARKKISTLGLFRLGLYFQTTLLLMAYALFLVLLPWLIEILYPEAAATPQSFIALSLILFFCLNWLLGVKRWDAEMDRVDQLSE
jgi:hypothetical protein